MMDVSLVETLADNLESYVKHLYALRKEINAGIKDANVIADYEEAVEIANIWNNLGEA